MRLTALVAALVTSVPIASPAHAWGPAGHQTVGSIADQVIAGTPAARQVDVILGGLTLRQAAVWADCAKGVMTTAQDYPYQPKFHDPACAVHETPDGISAMRDYVRRNDRNCALAPGDEETCHKVYHYADVAIQHDRYRRGWIGTSDHDVTGAIEACVAVLQGRPVPAPFSLQSRREALLLLAHVVGDVHQPLHVGAVYLDAAGRRVDPDAGRYDVATKTDGGNALTTGGKKMHGLWDAVSDPLGPDALNDNLVARARTVPVTAGPVDRWAQVWAGESVLAARQAFKDVRFGKKSAAGNWPATLPPHYAAAMDDDKEGRIVLAGARLAQVLRSVWP